ncbi:MAG: LamG domain-containing protein, partial [Verrucomicrobia bacterium]|nr:LamG domain-containing protein [Verrucomicrobiota bacterium]
VGELAIYNGYVLTPDQILAHYQAGTNTYYSTNYATMVMTAGAGTEPAFHTIKQHITLPVTYLRFNDPAYYPATNSGTLGYLANGDLSLTVNTATGPQAPAFAGFETDNTALPLDGQKQWTSLNNPTGLEFAGQITLEAWVQPSAVQGDPARIISHGPPTVTGFLSTSPVPDGAITNSPEVFLRIDGAGANYVVGSTLVIYTNTTDYSSNYYGASYAIPASDLQAGAWVHLAGTYDGSKWNLYRNGALVASAAGAVGALPVLEGDWAIGSTGNGWANNYAGGVDEVAIYGKALSAATVANHYNVGKNGAVALRFNAPTLSNGQVTMRPGVTPVSHSVDTRTGGAVSADYLPALTNSMPQEHLPGLSLIISQQLDPQAHLY